MPAEVCLHNCEWWCIVLALVVKYLRHGWRWGPGDNGLFTDGWLLCPHSVLLFHTTDKRTVLLASGGLWGNGSPLVPWSWVIWWEAPPKTLDALGESFATWWATQRSFCPVHTSWTSWISESIIPAEVAISWKMWERSSDPSWWKSVWCVWKYSCLMLRMSSESFLKASQWLSLRKFMRDLLSFHLQWGCSSEESSRLAASSSSGLEAVTSWSDDWHHHVVLVGGTSIDTVGEVAVNSGSPPAVASSGVVASMAASGTLLVRSSREYISTPRASRGQTHKAVPQTSTNAWWSCPSCTSTFHSSLSTLSSWDCSKLWAWVASWVSASLIVISWTVSASLIVASASLTVATCQTSTSLMASVAQFSF